MKFKIGVNYSQPLLNLLAQKEVRVDYIKLSRADVIASEIAVARKYRPALLHYFPPLGQSLSQWQAYPWQKLAHYIKITHCPHLSLHLDAYIHEVGPLSSEKLLTHLLNNYRFIKTQLEKFLPNKKIPLLVENSDHLPYEVEPYDRHQTVFQADFISQFLQQSQADFLLDLAHAKCSTHYLGLPLKKYLLNLPLDQVKEIHLAGARQIDGVWLDVHYALLKPDYQLLTWVLPHTKAQIITLEYGGTGEIYLTPEKNNQNSLKKQLLTLEKLLPDF